MLTPVIAGVIYLIFALILRKGLNKIYQMDENLQPSVTVVVAARNEADSIKNCLESLEQLVYPSHLLEILVINDRSCDNTGLIIQDFVREKPHFHYVENKKVPQNLNGKANAISQVISKTHGEIIFITDADCQVPPNWVKKGVSYFCQDVGIFSGFTLLNQSNDFFSSLQTLDWTLLLSAAAGAIGLKIPLSCIGNNLAIRRKAFDEVGGYEGVGFNVAEDFALLQAVVKKTNWKITFPLDADCLAQSKPVANLKNFLSQRKRWAIGGQSVFWFGKILIFFYLFIHLIFLSYLILNFHLLFVLIGFIILLAGDLLLISKPIKIFNKKPLLKYLLVHKFFSVFYMLTIALILIFNRRIKWKGNEYTANMVVNQE